MSVSLVHGLMRVTFRLHYEGLRTLVYVYHTHHAFSSLMGLEDVCCAPSDLHAIRVPGGYSETLSHVRTR